eukprot:1733708-Lingulodinium_polyedra.AAC.1
MATQCNSGVAARIGAITRSGFVVSGCCDRRAGCGLSVAVGSPWRCARAFWRQRAEDLIRA